MPRPPLSFIGSCLVVGICLGCGSSEQSDKASSVAAVHDETSVHSNSSSQATDLEERTSPASPATEPTPKFELLRELKGHKDTVLGLEFLSEGGFLVAGDDRGEVKLWDLATSQEQGSYPPPEESKDDRQAIHGVTASADGSLIGAASFGGEVRIWDAKTQQLKHVMLGHEEFIPVRAVAFAPDGSRLASGGDDELVVIWDVETGKSLFPLIEPNDDYRGDVIEGVAFSPDGSKLAVGGWNSRVLIWDVEQQKLIKTLKPNRGNVQAVEFSPDGKLLVTGQWDRCATIWNVASGKQVGEALTHEKYVSDVAFSPDGTMIAACDGNGDLKLWSAASGKELQTLKVTNGYTDAVAFSPAGNQIAVAAGRSIFIYEDQ